MIDSKLNEARGFLMKTVRYWIAALIALGAGVVTTAAVRADGSDQPTVQSPEQQEQQNEQAQQQQQQGQNGGG